MRYFVIWSDYDGPGIQVCEDRESAEALVNDIYREHPPGDENGLTEVRIIRGFELKIVSVEVVSKRRIVEG